MVGAGALVVMFLPIWPDFVEGPFVLRAGQDAVIRATVPGTVESVSVQEGQAVAAGSTLLQLRNSAVESEGALARSQLAGARARENQAALQYADFAAAQQERERQARSVELATERSRRLSIMAPVSGVVVTPNVADLEGRSIAEGDTLLQISDVARLKAEVYVPEFSMHDVRTGENVRLLAAGRVFPASGTVTSVAPTFALAEGLVSKDQLQGINPPRYYMATVWLNNNGELKPGVTGIAKVLVARRSLAGFGFEFTRDLVSRKIW